MLLCCLFSANFDFLLRYYGLNTESEEGVEALNMVLHTLNMMAKGGIHDHIGQVNYLQEFLREDEGQKLISLFSGKKTEISQKVL